jgi:hypothetical protein
MTRISSFACGSRPLSLQLLLLLVVAQAAFVPLEGRAQSLLQRTPNLSGAWVGPPGQLQMTMVHRFRVTSGQVRVVSVAPTLFAGTVLPGEILAGVNYSSASIVSPRTPNEFEFLARRKILSGADGSPLDLGITAGYNTAGRSADAELSVSGEVGRLRVLTVARGFTSPYDGEDARGALGVGAVLRLGPRSALVGDLTGLLDLDRDEGERLAWSVGIHVQVPVSPHTLSIHASNAVTTTLEGASLGTSRTRYGFEFTVPLTFSRIFGASVLPAQGSGVAGTPRIHR